MQSRAAEARAVVRRKDGPDAVGVPFKASLPAGALLQGKLVTSLKLEIRKEKCCLP